MHALCQVNLTELPFRPPRLDDLKFIAVFVGPDELPTDAANGTNWCLRAYRSVDQLVPLASLQTGSPIKPFPMRPKVIEEDSEQFGVSQSIAERHGPPVLVVWWD
jgi:hypothetical protein